MKNSCLVSSRWLSRYSASYCRMRSSAIINFVASPAAIHDMFSLMMRSTALPALRRFPRKPRFSSKPRMFCCLHQIRRNCRFKSSTSLRSPAMFSASRPVDNSMVIEASQRVVHAPANELGTSSALARR